MATVGLVVNPGASRDVRRLTSLARTIDANEQVNTVARVLCGLAAVGVETVLFMPEPSHVVERARDVLAAASAVAAWPPPRLLAVAIDGDGYATDAAGTTAAAAAIAAAGATCLVTLGGDGTNRAVAAGWPDAVLIPLAGGTNNAFGIRLDPTAAAYAAALYAADPSRHAAHVATRPRLEVTVGGLVTIALVDLAVVRGGWVGSHAIWDPDLLVEAIVARSDPTVPGMAGVAGTVHPLGERELLALHLAFGPSGRTMTAPLGPGQLVRIGVTGWRSFGPGETVLTPDRRNGVSGSVTLAFDGEREITLDRDEVAEVRLVADGPRVLDAAALLRQAATEGLLVAADPGDAGNRMMAPDADPPWRILADDGERDPRRNLALDEALGRVAGPEPTIRIWRNGRCVVVGRSQVADAEVDAAACRELDVPVLRRFTGGGAVYHDPGNMNVTIVLRRDDPRLVDRPSLARIPGLYQLLLQPLAAAVTSLGVPARATERDLLVDEAKVSGVAAWIGRQSLLVHGTLLVDADLGTLDRVLDGPGAPGDPRWERTRSRRATVTSLARALGTGNDPLQLQGLMTAAETAVMAEVADGNGRRGRVSDEEAATAGELIRARYGQPDWHRAGQ